MPKRYIEIFCRQAEAHVVSLRKGLRLLELDPARRTLLRELQLSAYTLKGSAGMVGLSSISSLAQAMTEQLKRVQEAGDADSHLFRSLHEAAERVAVLISAMANGAAPEFGAEPLPSRVQRTS